MHHSSLEIDSDCSVYQQLFFSIIRGVYCCVSIVPFYWCVVFQGGAVVKNPPANAGDARETGFDP